MIKLKINSVTGTLKRNADCLTIKVNKNNDSDRFLRNFSMFLVVYSIPSLNRHLWGFSKLPVYPVWRFKEMSNVGGQDYKKEQAILT